MTMATMVLVHGAWAGGFAWDDVVPRLEALGHEAVVIDRLPSVADDPAEVGGLGDDAAAVRAALDEVGSDAVLVGHSYGGIVITEVADHPAIVRSVYVAAYWPPKGMSFMDLTGGAPLPDWFDLTDERVVALGDADAVHRAIAADVDRAAFMRYFDRFGLQATAVSLTPSSAPPRSHPVTYVICSKDRMLPPEAQEQMAQQADDVVRLDSSHCPMLSMPDRLAEVLDAAAP